MLEHVPAWLGRAMAGWRAGLDSVVLADSQIGHDFSEIALSSPAFAAEARLPERFTADGSGVSPPLVWGDVPSTTATLALIVEDADAPTPSPLVHAVVWGVPPEAGRLEEGAIRDDGAGGPDGRDVGRNSYLRQGWLPPDPPTGHGVHRYVFQLFALDGTTPDPGQSPGRSAVVEAMAGHVLAAGVLIGTYSRGEAKASGEAGPALAPA